MLGYRLWGLRFAFSRWKKSTTLEAFRYVSCLKTLLNVSATPGIVTPRIGFRAEVSAGSPRVRGIWIPKRPRGTEFGLCNWCHSHCAAIIPAWPFCATFTHSTRVFTGKIDVGNHMTTFLVSNLHIIAAAPEVKFFPRPISSATSALGISESETHLITMNFVAQTWCPRKFLPGTPGMRYIWEEIRSAFEWRICQEFSSQASSTRHWHSNSLFIVLRILLNTELLFAGEIISLLVWAKVPANLVAVWVGTKTVASIWFGNHQGTEPPDDEQLQTQTAPKTLLFGQVSHTTEPHFCKFRTVASTRYLSSGCITIWYIHKSCSFGWSFTSFALIGSLINNHWAVAKNTQSCALFHSRSTNIDLTANWTPGGQRASRTASCTCILDCDTIKTEVHSWT